MCIFEIPANPPSPNPSSQREQVPRPVTIEQDVREMERRKRVDAIMSSKLFREELEKVTLNL